MRGYLVLFALISTALCAQDVLNQGVAAFRRADYQQAVEHFQQEVALHPESVNAHLYLGTAYMSQWVPGTQSADNAELGRLAETEFRRVLELDASNKTAIASLASLTYNQAGAFAGEKKNQKLDQAMDWYKRLADVDPGNKEAYYSMGVIAWTKWYPAFTMARMELGMKPEDPGILPAPVREELKAKYSSLIVDGIANLQQALAIDPRYDDAMAYLNLLIRERGVLRDTDEDYKADVAMADAWVQANLEVKRMKAALGPAVPPPPVPPPPTTPTRIRVGGQVQEANLIKKVTAVYPPLAVQAKISGQVRFTVIIGKDGALQNVQLISGHPLLVAAAQEAVLQYVYKPTLLNGTPVEVITQVDVNFSLSN